MSSRIVPASISIPAIRPTPPVKRAESLNHNMILASKQNLMGGKPADTGLSHLGFGELSEELSEELVVPSGAFELSLH